MIFHDFVALTALILAANLCGKIQEPVETEIEEIVYDETGCLYTSYTGLVMAGYQGWFTDSITSLLGSWQYDPA